MKIIHYPKYWLPYAEYTLKKRATYGCDIEAVYAMYVDAYAVDYREAAWAESEARITDVSYDWTTGLHMFELSYGNDVYRYVPVVYTGITRWAEEEGEHARFSIDEGKIEHMRFILRDGSMITVEPDNESWTMVVKDGTAVDIGND